LDIVAISIEKHPWITDRRKDIERQNRGEEKEEYIELVIEHRIPERAQLAALICSGFAGLKPQDVVQLQTSASGRRIFSRFQDIWSGDMSCRTLLLCVPLLSFSLILNMLTR
jgi:hypothetical protein